jgi:hypothetical protein
MQLVPLQRVQTTFLCRLLRSPLATVCAIRGACPAGGCAVALCCDYRVQSDAGTFGLNEVQLGIPVPKYWAKLFCLVAGRTAGDLTLQLGTLLTPPEAKAMGLLHEVVPIAAVLPAAERAMTEKFLRLPDAARGATKANMRGEFSAQWEGYIAEEAAAGWVGLYVALCMTPIGQPCTCEPMMWLLFRLRPIGVRVCGADPRRGPCSARPRSRRRSAGSSRACQRARPSCKT